ncbi:MAG: sulfotransferase family 2 domain-containing protein [Silicimonas sp.]
MRLKRLGASGALTKPTKLKELERWVNDKKRRVSPFFRRFPPNLETRFIVSSIRLLENRQAVYFRVPKAANSTVIATIMRHEGFQDLNFSTIDSFKKPLKPVTKLSRRELDDVVQNWFKFTVVRNPYTRILSAWQDKRDLFAWLIHRRLELSSDAEITLDLFLAYLEAGGINDDPHWARQTDVICVPISKLDKVAKVESLDRDLSLVMERIYGESHAVETFRPHATGASSLVKDMPKSKLTRIHRLYESDFDHLSYPSVFQG